MFKELHLLARSIYTFALVLLFMGVTGVDSFLAALIVGVTIFSFSFFWQYLVLHVLIRELPDVIGRWYFLVVWFVFCTAGIVGSAMMIPHMSEALMYNFVEEFAFALSFWGITLSVFGGAFVAMTCARRAFTRHGLLG
jgi:hypothetical protein